jgi:hypothetical protein
MMHDPNERPRAPEIDPTAIPERDAGDERLAMLLHAAVASEAPSWDALTARITMHGAPLLERRRSARVEMEWWELAARWSRAALPLAVAASALFILSLARHGESSTSFPTVRSALEQVVASSDGDTDLLHALIGSSGQTWAVRGAYERE